LLGHSCNLKDSFLIVFGGFTKGKYTNSIYTYNLAKLDWDKILPMEGSPMPEGRIGHASCIVGDYLYIFGGKGLDDKYLNDIWRFSFQNKKWEEIKPSSEIPKPRSGHTAIYSEKDNSIYYFGGKIGNILEVNEIWKFDINKSQFVILQDTLLEQHNENMDATETEMRKSFLKKSIIP
jgi:N-acetylneuraminic acid mutarotase